MSRYFNTTNKVRLIAFYLPQFHPIPENDAWWGKGFTEWVNVVRAKPIYEGHYQPHLPSDLGFYDLRVPEVRQQQAELAKEYGIYGFCYYYYWFGGKRLLHRPFDEVLKSGEPDFPFCLCWANENWTRRWDGLESEILIAQEYSEEDDRNFIKSVIPAFLDPRYIRLNNRPLLLVYRANLLPDAKRTSTIWREECEAAGVGEIYLCAAQSFESAEQWSININAYGFDAVVEFPPHATTNLPINRQIRITQPNFQGGIFDYLETVCARISRPKPGYKFFRTVMPAWDNTARRQNSSSIFHNSSPEIYKYWLRNVIRQTVEWYEGDERLVFINAWNEWAEGTHLEPDRKYGHSYLLATRDALNDSLPISALLEVEALVAQLRERDASITKYQAIINSTTFRLSLRLTSFFSRHPLISKMAQKLRPWAAPAARDEIE